MEKILIPCDGSPNSLRAVEHAAALAKACSTAPELELVFVHDPVTPRMHARLSNDEIAAQLREEGERLLQPARALLDAAQVRFHTTHLAGSVAHEIDRRARETGATAIVMGTRGLGRVAGALLGSTASGMIHLVNIPVTLVK